MYNAHRKYVGGETKVLYITQHSKREYNTLSAQKNAEVRKLKPSVL
jgi:hypothetical protein